MINKIKYGLFFWMMMLLVGTKVQAQATPGQLVDGIAAVVGNEMILESDIQENENYAKQQGSQATNRCEFLQSMLNQKVVIAAAKQDTLIENRSEAIRAGADEKYNRIMAQYPDEKTMLDTYKFRTSYEMKNAIQKLDEDQYYFQQKMQSITQNADVTPSDVSAFYKMYETQFPEVKDEVKLAKIIRYPRLTDAHKDELIARLKKIKQDITAGADFAEQARIYSEDEGTASQGGLMKNIRKGQMVKPFEAAALNLQEGEISDPVETEYGYHLIQLMKKSGKSYEARHILLLTKPNDAEIAAAKKELDSIRTLVQTGKITFREAAFKFSDDKTNKFNAGVITGEDGDRIEKESLDAGLAYTVAGLNKGDLTEVMDDQLNRRPAISFIQINDIIPAHKLTMETDYDRIKELALNKKRSEIMEKWVRDALPKTFVTIDDRYKSCELGDMWKAQSITK